MSLSDERATFVVVVRVNAQQKQPNLECEPNERKILNEESFQLEKIHLICLFYNVLV